MSKYLISFPSAAMVVPDGEWDAVVHDSHAVIEQAKAAGVYVFGGGIDEAVPPVLVSPDGAVAAGGAVGSAAYLVGVFGAAFIELILARLRRAGKDDADA